MMRRNNRGGGSFISDRSSGESDTFSRRLQDVLPKLGLCIFHWYKVDLLTKVGQQPVLSPVQNHVSNLVPIKHHLMTRAHVVVKQLTLCEAA